MSNTTETKHTKLLTKIREALEKDDRTVANISRDAGLAYSIVYAAVHGSTLSLEVAEKLHIYYFGKTFIRL